MRRVFILLNIILIGILRQCEPITDPGLDNPVDPDPHNPGAVAPLIDSLSGVIENDIIFDHTVNFEWSGNISAQQFSFQFDNAGWSNWDSIKTVSYQYLDEGEHLFEIKAKSSAGVESDIYSRHFIVNAISGPALRFYPRHVIVAANQQFSVDVYAEEVSDMAGVYLEIPLNPAGLTYISHTIYKTGDAFLAKDCDNVLSVEETEDQVLKVSLARISGEAPEVTGTGALMELVFQYSGSGDTRIDFATACQFQNEALTLFDFVGLVGCVVEAE